MFFPVVQAKSEVSFDRVEFVHEDSRDGHEGLFPTREPPRAGVPQWVAISLRGQVSGVRARLVTSPFQDIAALRLRESSSSGNEQEFIAQVTPPSVPFRVVVSGFDATGLPFQRVHAPMFEPTAR